MSYFLDLRRCQSEHPLRETYLITAGKQRPRKLLVTSIVDAPSFIATQSSLGRYYQERHMQHTHTYTPTHNLSMPVPVLPSTNNAGSEEKMAGIA